MKAIRIVATGGPEVLQYVDIPDLGTPGPGKALVRLKASGVNFMDVGHRRGTYPMPSPLPFIPGAEGAGVVEAVGEGVSAVKAGDRVAFTGVPGAYAEAVLADAERLIHLPEGISFEQGAAFPLQGITAHYLIHEYRKPKAGDVVLIHAAAGGMGGLLVQWARHLGATVIGTVSSEAKAATAKEAGANHVINYTRDDFAVEVKRLSDGHGADLIIDGVGKSTFKGDMEAAAVRGHIVIFGGASGSADPVSPNTFMPNSISVSGGNMRNFVRTPAELQQRAKDVMAGIKEGWLKLNLATLPLSEAAKAHQRLESRETQGKLVLTVA
jgi:NADPH2:quinone reductase